jgi:hypothetical protein
MSKKWVDNHDYFGPDRRRRPASKRWGDRRHDNAVGDLPSLGILLRRARVQMLSAAPDDRRRALQLLSAAVSEANRYGYLRCAEALQSADRILRAGGPHDVAAAEAKIVEAMDHLSAER